MAKIALFAFLVSQLLLSFIIASSPEGQASPVLAWTFPGFLWFSAPGGSTGLLYAAGTVHMGAALILLSFLPAVFRRYNIRRREALVRSIEGLLSEGFCTMSNADWTIIRAHFPVRDLRILRRELETMKKESSGGETSSG
jgi:hypothetical protein